MMRLKTDFRSSTTEFQSTEEVGEAKKRLLEIRGQFLERSLGVLLFYTVPQKGR